MRTLAESYSACKTTSATIMDTLVSSLEAQGLTPRCNHAGTEVILDSTKRSVQKKIQSLLEEVDPEKFLLYRKEQRGKTYIRLLYQ